MATRMMVTVDSPICPDCQGYGARQNTGQQSACGRCEGVGRLKVKVEVPDRVVCPTCHGDGQVDAKASKKESGTKPGDKADDQSS